jgi:hypothetical protein
MKPELPTIGSTMTQAIRRRAAANAARTASDVVERHRQRQLGQRRGTPGESGRPSVATPLPACTRNESPWP